MKSTRRPLRISAAVELVSLGVLLLNLATFHFQLVAALTGPVHGCTWLFSIVAALRDPHITRPTAAFAVIPGIGGLLALRRLDRADQAHAPEATASERVGPGHP
ncbi:hypothetical protein GCM10011583_69580 [Streptomyces camponoticapitis]|uniref:DUF3817 domain-containing protein n=1 Tax=Streptomyces camponoticapitis TaxID=1616125 RepID=A0ABQ2EV22_9ACTN|nr:DUF3817 domain-containing protein [Streptomyces camponoticapitis]GGK27645.1 hypothetical protein GCM10011583_69580 [Streptomyces camponoticapitis]